jgi:hypothetical protein
MLKKELIHNLCEEITNKEERELIESLLLEIPEKVLSPLQSINIDRESEPRRSNGEPIYAKYDPPTNVIIIYAKHARPSDPKYPCYLYHEIGHCIFHEFQDVARTAKIKCQEGEENKLDLFFYDNDLERWASEFCAKAYESFKCEQITNKKERYNSMTEYFERNGF